VVEDEASIREIVRLHLSLAGFDVEEIGDGKVALDRLGEAAFDLIVLDVMLPRVDGITLCRAIRSGETNARTPILMLTARDSESDKVVGLESGADDYLTTPFGVRELVELTKQEFDILYLLASRRGIVFSRTALLARVWGGDTYVTERTVDTVVSRLRRKIERDPQDPEIPRPSSIDTAERLASRAGRDARSSRSPCRSSILLQLGAANQQQRLVVELRAVGACAAKQAVGDRRQGPMVVGREDLFRPVEAELSVLVVEHLDDAVRQERKEVARLRVDGLRSEGGPVEHAHRELRLGDLLDPAVAHAEDRKMAGHSALETIVDAAPNTGDGDECCRRLQRHQHLVHVVQQRADAAGAARAHPHRALAQAHDDAWPDSMAGDIGDVGEPASLIVDHVHQIAAHVTAGVRPSEKLVGANPAVDGRYKNAMDVARDGDLGLRLEIACRRAVDEAKKHGVADRYGGNDANRVERQASGRCIWQQRERPIHHDDEDHMAHDGGGEVPFPDRQGKPGIEDRNGAPGHDVYRQQHVRLSPFADEVHRETDHRERAEDRRPEGEKLAGR
jgi:DNA-binding response OmpR family regulator